MMQMKHKYFNKEAGATDELHDLAYGPDRKVNHYISVSLEEWDFTQGSLRCNDGSRIIGLLQHDMKENKRLIIILY